MDSFKENFFNLMTVWREKNKVNKKLSFSDHLLDDFNASIFCPGEYYYFILNFASLGVEFIHPNVEKILGCRPEEFSIDSILKVMHPEDAASVQFKENAALEFLLKRIPPEKIPFYKSTYTFRITDGKGGWKHILHQSKALLVGDDGMLNFTVAVHSDITFMNIPADDRISFIGQNGEPSFYALSTAPANFLEPAQSQQLSPREREIVQHLAEGLSSKEIALKLQISRHTVDTHRRNLLRRFDASNTLELASLCLKRSLI